MIEKYKEKIVISGGIIEVYRYDNEILRGYEEKEHTPGNYGRALEANEQEKGVNRIKTQQRAKRNLRRTINANFNEWGENPKFITLTYADNEQDIKKCNLDFRLFIRRLGYKSGIKIKYSCVIEFQKRGAIHYHVIIYNLPYTSNKSLREVWGHGFVKINNIDNVDNVGAYVTKYMSKDNDDKRLIGQKCYFNSRELIKPTEITEKETVQRFLTSLDCSNKKPCYENTFANEFNTTLYKQYNYNKDLLKVQSNIK